jgi:acyl carrier protein
MSPENIIALIHQLSEEPLYLSADSSLVGGEAVIDSMGLVQLCLALEEKASENGFDFDWTSEKAMSAMHSIFKTPKAIADEFNRQHRLSLQQ